MWTNIKCKVTLYSFDIADSSCTSVSPTLLKYPCGSRLLWRHWCLDRIAAILQTFSHTFSWMKVLYLYPHTTKLLGVYWCHPVRPSGGASRFRCPLCCAYSSRYILSCNFRKCVARNLFARFQNLNFWQIFKNCSFDFVLFWLGVWCELLVWVVMGWWGYLRT